MPKKKQPLVLWIVVGSVVGLCGLCGIGGVVAGLGETEDSKSGSSSSQSDKDASSDDESSSNEEGNDEAKSDEKQDDPEPDPVHALVDMPDMSSDDLSGPAGKDMKLSKEQRMFFDIVAEAQSVGDDANDFAVVSARKDRGDAICDLLGSGLKVDDWVGVVDSVETTLGGDDGVLELSVSDGVKIATWNNGLSDIGDDTLIDENSPVWESLGSLEEGDVVQFSGHFVDDSENCLRESSIMDINGVLTPTFIFDFAKVRKQ